MEDRLQAEIVAWFNNQYCLKHHNPRCLIFAIPNGGNRNKIEAMKFKATGLLAGASDLVVILPNFVAFVELKTDLGIQSEVQKDFQNRVDALGFEYIIIKSLEQFKQWLNKRLPNELLQIQ
jgi:hypothetical protein